MLYIVWKKRWSGDAEIVGSYATLARAVEVREKLAKSTQHHTDDGFYVESRRIGVE